MSTISPSPYQTPIWSASSASIKLHSRARETEAASCAGVTVTKSLERIEIPQCIYDSCVGLGLLSQDPIGFAAGDANLYRYVGNHPTMATDPSGLAESWWEWMFGENDRPTPRGTSHFGSHGSLHLDNSYFNDRPAIEGMLPRPIPTQVCHGMSGMGREGPGNSFRFSDPRKIEQYIVFQEHMANMAMAASSVGGVIRSGSIARAAARGIPTIGEIAPSLSDDVLINLGSQTRDVVAPGIGRSYWFRFGDIRHLSPDQVRTLIGQMASAGTKEGSKVIRVAPSAVKGTRVPCTEGYFEYVIEGPVDIIQNIPIP